MSIAASDLKNGISDLRESKLINAEGAEGAETQRSQSENFLIAIKFTGCLNVGWDEKIDSYFWKT